MKPVIYPVISHWSVSSIMLLIDSNDRPANAMPINVSMMPMASHARLGADAMPIPDMSRIAPVMNDSILVIITIIMPPL